MGSILFSAGDAFHSTIFACRRLQAGLGGRVQRGRPADPANWIFETGFQRNHELQWYQPQNAFCKGGNLVIEARRERRRNPNHKKGSDDWRKGRKEIEYTSACVLTRGLHGWLYGRFEVRARIRTEPGLWPAIWFLGVEGNGRATERST